MGGFAKDKLTQSVPLEVFPGSRAASHAASEFAEV